MPSARQIAKVLAKRGIAPRHADWMHRMELTIASCVTEAEAVDAILREFRREELAELQTVVGDTLSAMAEVEKAMVPAPEMLQAAGDTRTWRPESE